MKKKKWLISASIFGMLLSGAGGVYAGSNLTEIKAFINSGISIFVDGKEYQAKDTKGNRLYPISYKNITYLPVRSVSDALDVPITYDAANNRVWIGEKSSSTAPTTPDASRPKHLPSDFPLPADAVRIELIESANSEGKKVLYTLQTKEDLSKWVETYNQYLQKNGYDGLVNSSTATKIEIIANSQNEKAVIEGSIINEKNGTVEYTIIWSQTTK